MCAPTMKQIRSCQYDSQSVNARARFSDIHTDGSAKSARATEAMNKRIAQPRAFTRGREPAQPGQHRETDGDVLARDREGNEERETEKRELEQPRRYALERGRGYHATPREKRCVVPKAFSSSSVAA